MVKIGFKPPGLNIRPKRTSQVDYVMGHLDFCTTNIDFGLLGLFALTNWAIDSLYLHLACSEEAKQSGGFPRVCAADDPEAHPSSPHRLLD